MAEIPVTFPGTPHATQHLARWETLTEDDTAEGWTPPPRAARAGAMQVTGTFGGATVALQGSNDGTTWSALDDVHGEAASLSAAGIVEFGTAARYIRPAATGGTDQDVDILICLQG